MISVIIEDENIIVDKMVVINDKNDVNHLKNSFRIKKEEIIRGTDGENEYLLKVCEIEKKSIVAEILEKREDNYSIDVQIDAAIGILKNDKMNLTIQKLTEIGIDRIIPFYSERSVVKLNEKKEKWNLISKEALKQCQGVKFVEILEPNKLEKIDFLQYDLLIVLYEATQENNLRELLKKQKVIPKKVLYIIGPEGGFSEKEISFLIEKKCNVVTLGKRIFRAETASIVVGGVLKNEFQ